MSLSICTKCFSRLHIIPHTPPTTRLRPFSTTPSLPSRAPQVKRNKAAFRQATNSRLAKKGRVVPKLPMIGERKALRKRLVLSNTNALEVHGMQDLGPQNMADEAQIGRVLGLSGELLDQLREVRAFKPTQNWNMFRKPGTLVRRESVELAREVSEISGGEKRDRPKMVRRIVAGERSTGKSLVLLQAMSLAFLNEWIVINVPEAQEYTIAHSAYAPMAPSEQSTPSAQQTIYNQPKLTAQLLQRVAKSNEKILKTLPLAHDPNMQGHSPKDLHTLALLGSENPHLSWPVWLALWKELTSSSSPQKRPPVLISIDGINHWMTLSHYRSADYSLIHAHQLAPIRHFLDILFNTNGATDLANTGGIILAATTGSNAPSVPSFDLLLRQLEARARGHPTIPMPTPYAKVDQRVLDLLRGGDSDDGLTVQRLSGLEKAVEARGLLEYFARSGVMREVVGEKEVGEKWSLAGGGVVGELARFGKRLRL